MPEDRTRGNSKEQEKPPSEDTLKFPVGQACHGGGMERLDLTIELPCIED